jgi:hypothetical protein
VAVCLIWIGRCEPCAAVRMAIECSCSCVSTSSWSMRILFLKKDDAKEDTEDDGGSWTKVVACRSFVAVGMDRALASSVSREEKIKYEYILSLSDTRFMSK